MSEPRPEDLKREAKRPSYPRCAICGKRLGNTDIWVRVDEKKWAHWHCPHP